MRLPFHGVFIVFVMVFSFSCLGGTQFEYLGKKMKWIDFQAHDPNASLSRIDSEHFFTFLDSKVIWTGVCYTPEEQNNGQIINLMFSRYSLDANGNNLARPYVGADIRTKSDVIKIKTLNNCSLIPHVMEAVLSRPRPYFDCERICSPYSDDGNYYVQFAMETKDKIYLKVRVMSWKTYVPFVQDTKYICQLTPQQPK